MSATPFSLRPWPTGDKKPKNLGEFVARVNAEPGGFRSVTEDKLREEIKVQEENAGADHTSPSSADEDEDDENGEDTKDAIAARDEFLRNCDNAHQSAMLALDAISLLLSKEMPVQAGTTLSSALRDAVGIGTLGASKLHDSNVTETRTKNDLAVATGWRVLGLNKMVDSVMAAAERLEKEMELEAKYWADVLAVSDSGWAVCSLPQDPHTLGVRFGFSEAAPEYRDSSLAPLRRQDDGTVQIDHSRVGKGSQRIRATIERNGEVTAHSHTPRRTPDDAPLPDRVLEARNTVFSQELWYELNREARSLLSYGIQMFDTEVIYPVGTDMKIILTLHDLTDEDENQAPSHPDQELADSTIMVLHFLLSYAHRQNYRARIQPSTIKAGPITPVYNILRPLITRIKHISALDSLTLFLEDLVSVLQKAGISTASYTKTAQPVAIQAQQEAQVRRSSKSEILSTNLIYSMDLQAELTITNECRISIRGRTFMSPFIGQHFKVILLPPPPPASSSAETQQQEAQQQQTSTTAPPGPLEISYPPAIDPYPDLASLTTYICSAALRALSHHLFEKATGSLGSDSGLVPDISRSACFADQAITANQGQKEIRLRITSGDDDYDDDNNNISGDGAANTTTTGTTAALSTDEKINASQQKQQQDNRSGHGRVVLVCEAHQRGSTRPATHQGPGETAAMTNDNNTSPVTIQRWTWSNIRKEEHIKRDPAGHGDNDDSGGSGSPDHHHNTGALEAVVVEVLGGGGGRGEMS